MSKYLILRISFPLFITFISCMAYASNSESSSNRNDDIDSTSFLASHPSDEYFAKEDQDKQTEYQKIISDYKDYLSSVKPKVMDEIREYRKEVVKINKKKKDLFNSLSQEAQKYLSKEDEVKKKLPINKGDINL